MRVVGVSFGEPEATARWVQNQDFPYEVWTDTDRTLALSLGAVDSPDASRPARVSALLDAEARPVVLYPEVSITRHPGQVLEDARRLFGPEAR